MLWTLRSNISINHPTPLSVLYISNIKLISKSNKTTAHRAHRIPNSFPIKHTPFYTISICSALLRCLEPGAFRPQPFPDALPHTSFGDRSQSDTHQTDAEVRLVACRHSPASRRSVHIGKCFHCKLLVLYTSIVISNKYSRWRKPSEFRPI